MTLNPNESKRTDICKCCYVDKTADRLRVRTFLTYLGLRINCSLGYFSLLVGRKGEGMNPKEEICIRDFFWSKWWFPRFRSFSDLGLPPKCPKTLQMTEL